MYIIRGDLVLIVVYRHVEVQAQSKLSILVVRAIQGDALIEEIINKTQHENCEDIGIKIQLFDPSNCSIFFGLLIKKIKD